MLRNKKKTSGRRMADGVLSRSSPQWESHRHVDKLAYRRMPRVPHSEPKSAATSARFR
jgi:hypothetical protein